MSLWLNPLSEEPRSFLTPAAGWHHLVSGALSSLLRGKSTWESVWGLWSPLVSRWGSWSSRTRCWGPSGNCCSNWTWTTVRTTWSPSSRATLATCGSSWRRCPGTGWGWTRSWGACVMWWRTTRRGEWRGGETPLEGLDYRWGCDLEPAILSSWILCWYHYYSFLYGRESNLDRMKHGKRKGLPKMVFQIAQEMMCSF